MNEQSEIKEPLKDFILNNPEFEKLENVIQEFNIFETLGSTYSELKHSNVLAWLLNPNENHGLQSYFLKQFFKSVMLENSKSDISFFDFELFDYSSVEVRREWKNIDLLVVIKEKDKKIVVVIENKIKASEHSDQLKRYWETIEREKEFQDNNVVKLFVFLTPEKLKPSDENEIWIPFNYEPISEIIQNIIDHKIDTLSSSISFYLTQYNTILRRYVVGNSDVEQIAVKIYKKHKKALDYIFKVKPDIDRELNDLFQDELKNNNEIIIFEDDSKAKNWIHFSTKTIDGKVKHNGEGWLKSNRILCFEIYIFCNEKKVDLSLYIGPGNEDDRKKLKNFFEKDPDLFKLAKRKFFKWHKVYQTPLLEKKDFNKYEEEQDDKALKEEAVSNLKTFLEKDLIKINDYFSDFFER